MKRLIFCSIALVLFTSSIFSQTIYYESLINPYWDFYTPNFLSVENAGKGYTGVASEGDLLSAALNPASFHPEKNYSVEVSYGIKTNTNYFPVMEDFILKNAFPSANIAVGYKLNENFSFGLRYNNDYNYKLDLGEMNGSNELGQITGKGNAFETFNTHSFSIPAVYSSKYFNLGVNLNLVLFHSNIHVVLTSPVDPEGKWGDISSNNTKFIPDFGLIVKPIDNLSFGFTFTPRSELEISRSLDNNTETSKTFTPMKLSAGAACKLFNGKLQVEANYRYENTSKKIGLQGSIPYELNFKDRNNFNIGIDYEAEKNLNFRAGFFTLLDNRVVDQTNLIPEDALAQYFLTTGLSYKVYNFSFDFAILTSEIIKSNNASHANFVLGIKYSFDSFK